MNPTQWQTQFDNLKQDHRVPLALAIFFGLLLLLALGQFIALFTTNHIKIAAIPANTAPAPTYPLANLHVLGVYSANLNTLPDSTLQLTLEGTAVNLSQPALSRAVIAGPGHNAKVYGTGDVLPGNATITRIAKHDVVVNDNGTLEKLPLPIEIISP
ncbi:MAG: hypothetical protein NTZ67_00120 [Gammaproteobacteria bacterium]|nr:hypothetical protein [Gammaproteobacteria bacterium]